MQVFSESDKVRIREALDRHGAQSRTCQMCGTSGWILADGWVFLSLTESLGNLRIGGPGLPCIALSCGNCGDTHLFNALILGLRDLVNRASGAGVP